jgi:hypothetical protein
VATGPGWANRRHPRRRCDGRSLAAGRPDPLRLRRHPPTRAASHQSRLTAPWITDPINDTELLSLINGHDFEDAVRPAIHRTLDPTREDDIFRLLRGQTKDSRDIISRAFRYCYRLEISSYKSKHRKRLAKFQINCPTAQSQSAIRASPDWVINVTVNRMGPRQTLAFYRDLEVGRVGGGSFVGAQQAEPQSQHHCGRLAEIFADEVEQGAPTPGDGFQQSKKCPQINEWPAHQSRHRLK